MTFTIAWRRCRTDDPLGPLCRDWQPDPDSMPWDGCGHDSCWAVVTGGRAS